MDAIYELLSLSLNTDGDLVEGMEVMDFKGMVEMLSELAWSLSTALSATLRGKSELLSDSWGSRGSPCCEYLANSPLWFLLFISRLTQPNRCLCRLSFISGLAHSNSGLELLTNLWSQTHGDRNTKCRDDGAGWPRCGGGCANERGNKRREVGNEEEQVGNEE